MTGAMSVQVDKEIVERVVQAQIQAAVVASLEGVEDKLLPLMVERVLSRKVDAQGRESQYSSDNRYTFIEWLARDAIQKAAERALRKFVEDNGAKIEAELARQLAAQKGEFARLFVAGLAQAAKSSWRFGVDVKFQESGD